MIGATVEGHLQRLEEVLKRLKSHGLRVKRSGVCAMMEVSDLLHLSLGR
jgi:hypothetical protein